MEPWSLCFYHPGAPKSVLWESRELPSSSWFHSKLLVSHDQCEFRLKGGGNFRSEWLSWEAMLANLKNRQPTDATFAVRIRVTDTRASENGHSQPSHAQAARPKSAADAVTPQKSTAFVDHTSTSTDSTPAKAPSAATAVPAEAKGRGQVAPASSKATLSPVRPTLPGDSGPMAAPTSAEAAMTSTQKLEGPPEAILSSAAKRAPFIDAFKPHVVEDLQGRKAGNIAMVKGKKKSQSRVAIPTAAQAIAPAEKIPESTASPGLRLKGRTDLNPRPKRAESTQSKARPSVTVHDGSEEEVEYTDDEDEGELSPHKLNHSSTRSTPDHVPLVDQDQLDALKLAISGDVQGSLLRSEEEREMIKDLSNTLNSVVITQTRGQRVCGKPTKPTPPELAPVTVESPAAAASGESVTTTEFSVPGPAAIDIAPRPPVSFYRNLPSFPLLHLPPVRSTGPKKVIQVVNLLHGSLNPRTFELDFFTISERSIRQEIVWKWGYFASDEKQTDLLIEGATHFPDVQRAMPIRDWVNDFTKSLTRHVRAYLIAKPIDLAGEDDALEVVAPAGQVASQSDVSTTPAATESEVKMQDGPLSTAVSHKSSTAAPVPFLAICPAKPSASSPPTPAGTEEQTAAVALSSPPTACSPMAKINRPPSLAHSITTSRSARSLSPDSRSSLREQYFDELLASTTNTNASRRLYSILKAEEVSLDSSLGLQLLDLAKALRSDGELGAAQSVQPAQVEDKPEKSDVMLSKVLSVLNDHSAMLNVIAEATGVNLLDDDKSEASESTESLSVSSNPLDSLDAGEIFCLSPPRFTSTYGARSIISISSTSSSSSSPEPSVSYIEAATEALTVPAERPTVDASQVQAQIPVAPPVNQSSTETQDPVDSPGGAAARLAQVAAQLDAAPALFSAGPVPPVDLPSDAVECRRPVLEDQGGFDTAGIVGATEDGALLPDPSYTSSHIASATAYSRYMTHPADGLPMRLPHESPVFASRAHGPAPSDWHEARPLPNVDHIPANHEARSRSPIPPAWSRWSPHHGGRPLAPLHHGSHEWHYHHYPHYPYPPAMHGGFEPARPPPFQHAHPRHDEGFAHGHHGPPHAPYHGPRGYYHAYHHTPPHMFSPHSHPFGIPRW